MDDTRDGLTGQVAAPTQTVATTDLIARALLAMQRYPWEQGVAMQAFLERGDLDLVIPLAFEAVHRQAADGRAAEIGGTGAVTDPCSVGEALLAAYRQTGDPQLKAGLDALVDWAVNRAPRSAEGILYHLEGSRQFWADSLYMLPPFLAAAGHIDLALTNYFGYWQALYDPATQLMSHMWDDESKTFVRAAHWGSGSGWALAATARLIGQLQGQAAWADQVERLKDNARQLLTGVLAQVRPDGLFYDVVDDPTTFVETNLTQMTAYTIYRGLCAGWLEPSWRSTADRLRVAAEAKVDAYGFVTDVCGAPTFDKPGYSAEAQAFALLMEAAAARL